MGKVINMWAWRRAKRFKESGEEFRPIAFPSEGETPIKNNRLSWTSPSSSANIYALGKLREKVREDWEGDIKNAIKEYQDRKKVKDWFMQVKKFNDEKKQREYEERVENNKKTLREYNIKKD